MNWKEFFRNLLRGGVTISYSDGKTFDPSMQERTDAIDDLIKGKKKED